MNFDFNLLLNLTWSQELEPKLQNSGSGQTFRLHNTVLYILEQPSIVSTAANESILAPFSKQTESFHSPHEIEHLTTFHADSLAWLAQILLLIRVSMQTLINHIDTHHG